MAISQDIRIQYANSINKNIRFGVPVNDNENSQRSIQLISSDLSALTVTASRVKSIIKNQILLSRFEYKEKARIQKEINAETTNGLSGPAIQPAENTNDIASLASVLGPMFDDLTERVTALAESASAACPGAGLDVDLGRRAGRGGTAKRGALRKAGSTLLDIAGGAAAIAGTAYLATGALGLVGAYQSFQPEEAPESTPEQPQPETPAQVAAPSVTPERATAAAAAVAAAPAAGIVKDATGQEYVTQEGSDKAYKLTRREDGSTSIDLSQETSLAAIRTPVPTSRTPTIPTARNAPQAAAAPVSRPAPVVPKPAPTSGFNWPSLFTGIAASVSSAVRNFGRGADQGYRNVRPAGSSQNADIAMNYFMSQGWAREQAAGIVGNLQQESTKYLDPNITNQIGMYGIAQWDTSRRNNFQRQFGKSIYGSSFEEQLRYIQWELNNTHKRAGEMLRAARTPEEAARIIQNYYEVAPGQNDNQRIANALALAGQDTFATQVGRTFGSLGAAVSSFYEDAMSRITGTGRFIYPLTSVRLTSSFGPRGGRMHEGLDFGARRHGVEGDPIHASAAGVVSFVGPAGAYGNLIKITHPNGYETRYGHLRGFAVRVGQSVTQGQQIGIMGNTGRSFGAHLHFEIRRDGRALNPEGLLGRSFPVRPDDRATEPGAQERPPGSPGWSLTQTRTDDPRSRTIQERRVDQYIRDAFRQRPSIPSILIQNPPPSPTISMGVRGGRGPVMPGRGGRDIGADFRRGFGL